MQDCFEFIGARENPYAYMKNADVLVQTSRFEGKSVVLDEGKILCCPIVTTNYPTVYDQINKDEGRWLKSISKKSNFVSLFGFVRSDAINIAFASPSKAKIL